MGAPVEEPGCALAGALLAWRLDGRFPGGFGGLARQGRAEPVAFGDLETDGVQADHGGVQNLAPIERRKAIAESH